MLKGIRRAVGHLLHPKAKVGRPDVRLNHVRVGSDYGGWAIVPDGLGPGSIVYSFGIGEDASFDTGLIERFGCAVHAFDPTPKSIAWVHAQRRAGTLTDRFVLHEFGLSDRDGTLTFFAPANPGHVSHSAVQHQWASDQSIVVPVKRLSTIMRELGHDRVDLLKMDIEGSEYGVVEDLVASGAPVRQLLIEFHHRFPEIGPGKTEAALARLRTAGYDLFCIAPSDEEYSFIRREG